MFDVFRVCWATTCTIQTAQESAWNAKRESQCVCVRVYVSKFIELKRITTSQFLTHRLSHTSVAAHARTGCVCLSVCNKQCESERARESWCAQRERERVRAESAEKNLVCKIHVTESKHFLLTDLTVSQWCMFNENRVVLIVLNGDIDNLFLFFDFLFLKFLFSTRFICRTIVRRREYQLESKQSSVRKIIPN